VPGTRGGPFEVEAELVGLLEVLVDQFRRGGGRPVEVDVLDVLDAGEAEAPLVDDLADRLVAALMLCPMVRRSSSMEV
jgi:hypothetical protein